MMKNYIKLLRPKQWIKNVLVFAALFFSKSLFDVPVVLITLCGFVIFCMLSSAVYIINDIVDREKDRNHPKKCKRPIASGAISVKAAATVCGVLLLVGAVWAFYLSWSFALVGVIYLCLNLAYTFRLKRFPIIDIMCIAAGFVLRALAGGVLISNHVSPWLIVCTMLLALFLAIHKRKSELMAAKSENGSTRDVLVHYNDAMLRDMASMIDSTTIMAYCLYTFTSDQSIYLMFTIPFVIYGLFRYQYIMHKTDLGESPELALLQDKPLLVDVLLWMVACGIILYLG